MTTAPSDTAKTRRGAAGAVAAFHARARRVPLALALLTLVAFVHATAWAVITAPLNGPDENQHVAYTQLLAETGDGPQRNKGLGPYSWELGQLAYELNLVPIQGQAGGRPDWGEARALERKLGPLPDDARKGGDGPNAAASNPPLYYAYTAVAYRLSPDQSPLGRLFAMRMATVLLLPLTVILTWLFAAHLFASQWPRALMAGVVALHPKLGSIAGIVNPDMLLVLAGAAFLHAGIAVVRLGPSRGRLAWLGIATAAGVLTQGRGLFVVPVALLVLAYALWRWRPAWRAALVNFAIPLALVGAALLITVLWTRGHTGGATYGGQLPGTTGFQIREFAAYLWQFYFDKLSFMGPRVGPDYGYRQVWIETYFGSIASLEINYRPWVYDWIQVGAAAGIVGLYTAVVARWRVLVARWPTVLFCVATFLSLMAMLHIVSYTNLRSGPDPVITGRYLLPLVGLYAAAIAFTCRSLPRRAGLPVAGAIVGLHLVLVLVALGTAVTRFHA